MIRADRCIIGGKVTHEYGKALNGFAAEIEPLYFNRLSNSLTSSSAIDYIGSHYLSIDIHCILMFFSEPDGEVTIQ